jgi:hypothetical protein
MATPKKKQFKLAKWTLNGAPVYVKQYPKDKLKRKARKVVSATLKKLKEAR